VVSSERANWNDKLIINSLKKHTISHGSCEIPIGWRIPCAEPLPE